MGLYWSAYWEVYLLFWNSSLQLILCLYLKELFCQLGIHYENNAVTPHLNSRISKDFQHLYEPWLLLHQLLKKKFWWITTVVLFYSFAHNSYQFWYHCSHRSDEIWQHRNNSKIWQCDRLKTNQQLILTIIFSGKPKTRKMFCKLWWMFAKHRLGNDLTFPLCSF